MKSELQGTKKTVIIFNGPPACGKDFAAKELIDDLNARGYVAHHMQFKEKLIQLACDFYDMSREEWDSLYTRELKEIPMMRFHGRSMREVLIHVSEDVTKPNFGKDYFGVSASRNLKEGINVFSDGGFVEEISPLIEHVGQENLMIVRIHPYVNGEVRGFEGVKDSRSYIQNDNILSCDVTNYFDQNFLASIKAKIHDTVERNLVAQPREMSMG